MQSLGAQFEGNPCAPKRAQYYHQPTGNLHIFQAPYDFPAKKPTSYMVDAIRVPQIFCEKARFCTFEVQVIATLSHRLPSHKGAANQALLGWLASSSIGASIVSRVLALWCGGPLRISRLASSRPKCPGFRQASLPPETPLQTSAPSAFLSPCFGLKDDRKPAT
jgi:hypothetical protein